MAAPCTDHLFLTGQRGVGKSTLLRCLLEGKRPGGFFKTEWLDMANLCGKTDTEAVLYVIFRKTRIF